MLYNQSSENTDTDAEDSVNGDIDSKSLGVLGQLLDRIVQQQKKDGSHEALSAYQNINQQSDPTKSQLKSLLEQYVLLQNEILEKGEEPMNLLSSTRESVRGQENVASCSSHKTPPASPQGLQVPIVSSSVKPEEKLQTSTESLDGSHDPETNEISNDEYIQDDLVEDAEVEDSLIHTRSRSKHTQKSLPLEFAKEFVDRQKVKKFAEGPSVQKEKSVNLRNKAAQLISVEKEMTAKTLKVGDLIWGQMRGYPSWPGKIVRASEVRCIQQRTPLVDGKVWVKWFGDHTFAQMNPQDFKSMTEGLESYTKTKKKCRTRNKKISNRLEIAIQEAVDELEKQQQKQVNKKIAKSPAKLTRTIKKTR